MRWFVRLLRNAVIGAIVYNVILGILVGLSAMAGQTEHWTSGWEEKLLQVWLFAASAGAFLGAGCTHGPKGNKKAGFVTMASCLVLGTIVLYFPLSRVSSSTATTLLMLGLFFTGPALLVTGISQVSAPDQVTQASGDTKTEA